MWSNFRNVKSLFEESEVGRGETQVLFFLLARSRTPHWCDYTSIGETYYIYIYIYVYAYMDVCQMFLFSSAS